MEAQEWIELEESQVYTTPYVTVLSKRFFRPRTEDEVEYTILCKKDGVHVVVLHQGKIVLTRQWRPALESFSIEVPAGAIEPKEDIEQALRREIHEETGYQVGQIKFFGNYSQDTSHLQGGMHLGLACATEKTGQGSLEVLEVPLSEAMEMIKNQKIVDLPSAMAIFLAFTFLALSEEDG